MDTNFVTLLSLSTKNSKLSISISTKNKTKTNNYQQQVFEESTNGTKLP